MTTHNPLLRRYRLAVWLLALLNAGLLAFMLFVPPAPPRVPKQRILNQWNRSLALNETQRHQFEMLFDRHRAEIDSLRRKLRLNRNLLIESLAQHPVDTIRAWEICRQSAVWELQLNENLIRHYLDLQGVCTPEQREKMGQAFRKTLPKHPPGPVQ